jgi:hypothetical protein
MQTLTPLFNLRVGVPEMILPVNVDATAARRKVSGWAGGYVATTCGGSTPELVIQDAQPFWRVPVVFTCIGVGVVGVVGDVLVNAQTGELQPTETTEARADAMRKSAARLYKALKAQGHTFKIKSAKAAMQHA